MLSDEGGKPQNQREEQKMKASTELAIRMGRCMLETRFTMKQIGKEFGVSQSTAHRYIRINLPSVNPDISHQCNMIIEYNKSIAHLRGGEGNRIKHLELKKKSI